MIHQQQYSDHHGSCRILAKWWYMFSACRRRPQLHHSSGQPPKQQPKAPWALHPATRAHSAAQGSQVDWCSPAPLCCTAAASSHAHAQHDVFFCYYIQHMCKDILGQGTRCLPRGHDLMCASAAAVHGSTATAPPPGQSKSTTTPTRGNTHT